MLELRDLSFGYGARTIGSSVSLTHGSGEVLALLGPNGAGKTTLFKTMLGLLPPQAGDVRFDGASLATLSRTERAKRIAYVPQAHAALFPFTVRDVVLMGRAAQVAPFPHPAGGTGRLRPVRSIGSACPTWRIGPIPRFPAASGRWH